MGGFQKFVRNVVVVVCGADQVVQIVGVVVVLVEILRVGNFAEVFYVIAAHVVVVCFLLLQ